MIGVIHFGGLRVADNRGKMFYEYKPNILPDESTSDGDIISHANWKSSS